MGVDIAVVSEIDNKRFFLNNFTFTIRREVKDTGATSITKFCGNCAKTIFYLFFEKSLVRQNGFNAGLLGLEFCFFVHKLVYFQMSKTRQLDIKDCLRLDFVNR